MDDILKKAFRQEVEEVFERIEEIVNKYNHSGEIVYTAAFGMVEEEDEENRKWNLAYGWNCKDIEEYGEFMQLQLVAFTKEEEDEAQSWFDGLSLN